MALEPGSRLGPYEVLAPLGKGGMGEVWRARDTKLGREVAIKTLPAEFAADADRLARFEREAKLLASLNHPNIGGIYGLEDFPAGDAIDPRTPVLVLELVEGETLADRLAAGPLVAREALGLALQIAEALEAAHEKGVIHRDLKPANICVTPDGTVKVLDFGLAKVFETPDASPQVTNSPTLSMAATRQGLVLGTAGYMSPEQAKGQATDRRTDIWAFGAVLFEMLTGRQAFEGDDVSEILASVIKGSTNLEALPADLPAGARRLVARCLTKDLRRRFQDIGDVRYELERVLSGSDQPAPTSSTSPSAPSRSPWPVLVAAVLAALVGGAATWMLRPGPTAEVTRFEHALPGDLVFQNSSRNLVAFAPDGRQFVYNTADGLFLRPLGAEEPRLLFGAENGTVRTPVFSPDGQWVAYFSVRSGRIEKLAVSGGAPVALAEVAMPFGMSWEADGTLLFGERAGIMRVSENGGEPELVVAAEEGEQLDSPRLLPDGDWMLVSSATTGGADRWNQGRVLAVSLATGERRVLVEGGADAQYLPTGHLVYALDNGLFVIGFDLDGPNVVGGPVSVIENVQRATIPQNNTGTGHYSVSANGHLVYVERGAAEAEVRTLALVDRTGRVQRLDVPPNQYISPRVSPAGDRLAVQTDGETSVIWTYGLSGETAIQRLTQDGNAFRPVWTPDGERITFTSDRDGSMSLYWQNADGSGVPERLTTAGDGEAHWAEAWSPDGRTLIYKVEQSPSGGWNGNTNEMDLWTLSLDEPETPQPFANEPLPVLELGAGFSPDGTWLAYTVGDGTGGGVRDLGTAVPAHG